MAVFGTTINLGNALIDVNHRVGYAPDSSVFARSTSPRPTRYPDPLDAVRDETHARGARLSRVASPVKDAESDVRTGTTRAMGNVKT